MFNQDDKAKNHWKKNAKQISFWLPMSINREKVIRPNQGTNEELIRSELLSSL
jgi:hypothetical protein